MSGFQNQYNSVVQYHCDEPFYTLSRHVDGNIYILNKKYIINNQILS